MKNLLCGTCKKKCRGTEVAIRSVRMWLGAFIKFAWFQLNFLEPPKGSFLLGLGSFKIVIRGRADLCIYWAAMSPKANERSMRLQKTTVSMAKFNGKVMKRKGFHLHYLVTKCNWRRHWNVILVISKVHCTNNFITGSITWISRFWALIRFVELTFKVYCCSLDWLFCLALCAGHRLFKSAVLYSAEVKIAVSKSTKTLRVDVAWWFPFLVTISSLSATNLSESMSDPALLFPWSFFQFNKHGLSTLVVDAMRLISKSEFESQQRSMNGNAFWHWEFNCEVVRLRARVDSEERLS